MLKATNAIGLSPDNDDRTHQNQHREFGGCQDERPTFGQNNCSDEVLDGFLIQANEIKDRAMSVLRKASWIINKSIAKFFWDAFRLQLTLVGTDITKENENRQCFYEILEVC